MLKLKLDLLGEFTNKESESKKRRKKLLPQKLLKRKVLEDALLPQLLQHQHSQLLITNRKMKLKTNYLSNRVQKVS